jgi:peptidyl-prolyl cis-trans isomerase B (cyclophilin B)
MRRNVLPCITIVLFLFGARAQSSFTFSGKPVYEITAKQNNATLGVIRVELFPAIAPLHVRNFDSLVSVKFFDTTAFHRIVPGFVIQGGDPNSRHGPTSTWGFGDPGQPMVKAEFSKARHDRGILSAARKGNDINSATSQFFICVDTAFRLDGKYSVYGRVAAGMNVADTIVSRPRTLPNNMPVQKIEMFVKRDGSNDAAPAAPALLTPVHGMVDVPLFDTVKLNWQPLPDAIIYEAEIARDEQFLNTFSVVATGLPALEVFDVEYMTTYYWRVRANNGGKLGPYSATWNFTTIGDYAGVATRQAAGPMVYYDGIQGSLLFSGLSYRARITLHDLSGRELYAAQASTYRLSLRINLSYGLYLYSISDGTDTQYGKIIIN